MTLNEHITQYRALLTHLLTSDNADIVKSEQQMFRAIENISKDYGEEGMSEFAKLFDIKEHNIGAYAARYLLMVVQPPEGVVAKALSVIEEYAVGDATNADFFRDWLNVWYANHMNEQEYNTRKQIFIKLSISYAIAMLIAVTLSPLLERYIQVETVNYVFIDFVLIHLVNALYYYLLERKLKKGITNKMVLTVLLTMASLAVTSIILIPFTYFSVIKEPVHPGILLSTTFVISVILGVSVAKHFWLRNSWAGRKLPRSPKFP